MVTIHTTCQILVTLHFVSIVSNSNHRPSPRLLVVVSPVSCLQALPRLAAGLVYLAICRCPFFGLPARLVTWRLPSRIRFVVRHPYYMPSPLQSFPTHVRYPVSVCTSVQCTVCRHVQSHTAHCSLVVYYLATSLDLKWQSSSGLCAVT
jgi:hypothetical protein